MTDPVEVATLALSGIAALAGLYSAAADWRAGRRPKPVFQLRRTDYGDGDTGLFALWIVNPSGVGIRVSKISCGAGAALFPTSAGIRDDGFSSIFCASAIPASGNTSLQGDWRSSGEEAQAADFAIRFARADRPVKMTITWSWSDGHHKAIRSRIRATP